MSLHETNTHPRGGDAAAKAMSGVDYAAFAHDLRTPLGGMDALVTLLRQTALSTEQARLLDALGAACQHLRDLADRVLAPVPPLGELSPLGDMLAAFSTSADARARRRGLGFILRVEDALDVASIHVEAGVLRQVLENLIDNAMRLTPDGGVELCLSPGGSPGRVCVRLTDSGPGLTMEDAARLIRQGGQIAGRAGGAGMGLCLSGALVAERGGHLQGGARRDGKPGAEFRFDWPITLMPAVAFHPQEGRGAPIPVVGGPSASSLPDACEIQAHLFPQSPHLCLVVDDHPAARLILMTILGAMGVLCEEAADIEAGWMKVQTRRYRAVFTDLNMPDGGGAILLERIAHLPEDRRPMSIIVSAGGELMETAVVDACLHKPISVPAIQALVERFELAAKQGEG